MSEQAQAILRGNPKTADELRAITDKHPILMPGGTGTMEDALEAVGVPTVEEEDEEPADEEEAPPPTYGRDSALSARQRAVVKKFDDACKVLLGLSATASALLANGIIEHDDLDMLGNFLKQVAASKRGATDGDYSLPADGSIPLFLDRRVPAGGAP
jgi:hypothetical protein